jgi:hypothetical protein
LIDADSDTVDRDAFQEIGSTHAAARQALELVARTGAADDAEPLPITDQSQDVRPAAASAPAALPSSAPATLPSSSATDTRYTTDESKRLRGIVDGFMSNLSPAELEEVRAHLARRKEGSQGDGSALEGDAAQKPPTS